MPSLFSRFSLRVYITCLFATIILLLGLLLIYAQHRHNSTFLLADSERRLGRLAGEIGQRLGHNLHGVGTGLELMRASDVRLTGSEQDPARWWPLMQTLLDANPQVISFYVGEPDGRGLFFRAMRNGPMRTFFGTPAAAEFVMDITTPGQLTRRFYLGRDQRVLSSTRVDSGRFDIRLRPWYGAAQARTGTAITPPYYFHFLREPGITLSLADTGRERVWAADLLLDDLAQLLGGEHDQGRSLLWLAPGRQILASNLAELTPGDDGSGMPTLDRLPGFSSQPAAPGSAGWRTELDGTPWLGHQTTIPLPATGTPALDLRLATLVPYRSLMADALHFSRNQILLTLALTLLSLPLVIWASQAISRPLLRMAEDMNGIQEFDFHYRGPARSFFRELDILARAMSLMSRTLDSFTQELHTLAQSGDFNQLLQQVRKGILTLTHGQRCLIYRARQQQDGRILLLQTEPHRHQLTLPANAGPEQIGALLMAELDGHGLRFEPPWLLYDRFGKLNGAIVLGLRYSAPALAPGKRRFIAHYTEFANLALEGMSLFEQQRQMTESMIRVIASAIDAKSPYTSGHCQRVPELTLMLARAVCASQEGLYADFRLSDNEWEALYLAAWLHDCGKVVTPEQVMDKATKLETIYNRLHEVRMRFEVLKRDADIAYWQGLARGEPPATLVRARQRRHRQLDGDFAFIAELNQGGESVDDDRLARLRRIAEQRWQRTLDDTLGLSREEAERRGPAGALPAWEPLLDDKPWHRQPYPAQERIGPDNPWGITLVQPALKFNLGESYNLAIPRGTLTPEERYIINAHMVHTLIMLSQLPYPSHLSDVPLLAAGHHERMDGTGYPRGLKAAELPLQARMMALADVFEALTAADRPYKQAKTVSQSLRIMATMVREQHLDGDLFRFFVERRIYRDYGQRFLQPAQLDEVDSAAILAQAGL